LEPGFLQRRLAQKQPRTSPRVRRGGFGIANLNALEEQHASVAEISTGALPPPSARPFGTNRGAGELTAPGREAARCYRTPVANSSEPSSAPQVFAF
jgi:hypothetical protein